VRGARGLRPGPERIDGHAHRAAAAGEPAHDNRAGSDHSRGVEQPVGGCGYLSRRLQPGDHGRQPS